MKKSLIVLSTAILIMLPVMSHASTGQIIATNSSTSVFYDFSAPAGEYITQINGYWNMGVGYIDVNTNGGSSGTILITQDPQIYFNGITVGLGDHIIRIGPDGPDYLSVWTESVTSNDIIYNIGGNSTWDFTDFTAPACEVITGFTSSSSGGWAYLNAVSSPLMVIVSGGGTFCNSATLTASGGLGGTIYWQDTISGGTSTAIPSTSQTVTSSGTYYFREYNSCGWGPEGSATVIIDTTNTGPTGVTALVSQTSLCSGDTIILTGGASGATSWSWTGPGGFTSTMQNPITTAISSGHFILTASNGCGSDTAQTPNVTVYIVDTLVIQSGVTLTANATGAAYQWIDCNGNISIPGQTNQSYTATANGSYAVIVTQNSCSDTSSCYNITTVGILENSSAAAISIYPNPSIGKFIIEMENLKGQIENGVIEIYNVIGERIYSTNLKQQYSNEIDFSKSHRGVYFIKIYEGEKIYTEKIVIQ